MRLRGTSLNRGTTASFALVGVRASKVVVERPVRR